MAVDRQARDELAKLVIDYMADRIRTDEFDHGNMNIEDQDPSVRACVGALWFFHDDFVDHPISVSSEGWNWILRIVALLRSDLEMSPKTQKAVRISWRLWLLLIPMAGVGLITLLRTGQIWLALALGLVSAHPLFWTLGLLSHLCHRVKLALAGASQSEDLWPFEDKAQWESHRHLLEGLAIPEYDPQVHRRPIRPHGGWWLYAMNIMIAAIIITVIAAAWAGLIWAD